MPASAFNLLHPDEATGPAGGQAQPLTAACRGKVHREADSLGELGQSKPISQDAGDRLHKCTLVGSESGARFGSHSGCLSQRPKQQRVASWQEQEHIPAAAAALRKWCRQVA